MSEPALFTRLFDAMPLGVVAMDRESRVVFYNRYEEQLAERRRGDVLTKPFFDEVAPCVETVGLKDHFFEHVEAGTLDRDVQFHFPKPNVSRPRDVRLVLSSMELEGQPMGVLFVQDVSAVRAVERTKDFLVRTLAHDMNNPLMAIATGLDLFEASEQPPERERYWGDTFEAIERLRSMVLNLHDITRLHTTDVPLTMRDHDVCTIAGEALDDNRVAAARRGITIRLEHDPAPIEAEVDAALIRRALDNLLENALRYSEDGGTVTVAIRRRGMRVACEVIDHGPGVEPEIRERIFSPEISGRNGTVGPSNRGLGLAFVDLVARAHGGAVVLDCPAQGGSIFTLELPVTHVSSTRR